MTSDNCNTSSLVFTKITMDQMARVETIRAASGSTLYVYAFASLFAWQKHEKYSICLTDDAFLIKYGARGDNAYMFPCGSETGKKKLLDTLLQYESPVFSYVSDGDRLFLEKTYPDRFVFEECRDDFPYLYDKDRQLALEGKEFKDLRHRIRVGRDSAKEWSSEPLTPGNVERAIVINRRWAEDRMTGDLADTAVAEEALKHFSELRLWGRLYQADGEDAAYAAGIFITPEVFDISFCKVIDKQCDCYIKWVLYSELPEEVKTVDSEEDMGLAGLRQHKLLRRPKELVRIWKGTLK